MEDRLLHQSTPTTTIIYRIATVLIIAALSIWANYEASKGYKITIINDAAHTPSGRRFHLMFVHDDKAIRILLNTSKFAEHVLYPNDRFPRKAVDSVTLRLTSRNATQEAIVIVHRGNGQYQFEIQIGTRVMESARVESAVVEALQRAMARMWLWDGDGAAPTSLLDGMAEYVSALAGFGSPPPVPPESDVGCWEGADRVGVARFLQYCEGLRHGFVARLNRAMQGNWHVGAVDEALGLPARRLCGSYDWPLRLPHASDSTSATAWSQVM